jgi:hypothetical protein
MKASQQLPRLTEKQFQQQVLDLAHACGWRTYHTFDSRRSTEGFPDLVLVNRAHCWTVFVELKGDNGVVSKAQQSWIDDLRETGEHAAIWRPKDWPHIEAFLTGRRPRAGEGSGQHRGQAGDPSLVATRDATDAGAPPSSVAASPEPSTAPIPCEGARATTTAARPETLAEGAALTPEPRPGRSVSSTDGDRLDPGEERRM